MAKLAVDLSKRILTLLQQIDIHDDISPWIHLPIPVQEKMRLIISLALDDLDKWPHSFMNRLRSILDRVHGAKFGHGKAWVPDETLDAVGLEVRCLICGYHVQSGLTDIVLDLRIGSQTFVPSDSTPKGRYGMDLQSDHSGLVFSRSYRASSRSSRRRC